MPKKRASRLVHFWHAERQAYGEWKRFIADEAHQRDLNCIVEEGLRFIRDRLIERDGSDYHISRLTEEERSKLNILIYQRVVQLRQKLGFSARIADHVAYAVVDRINSECQRTRNAVSRSEADRVWNRVKANLRNDGTGGFIGLIFCNLLILCPFLIASALGYWLLMAGIKPWLAVIGSLLAWHLTRRVIYHLLIHTLGR